MPPSLDSVKAGIRAALTQPLDVRMSSTLTEASHKIMAAGVEADADMLLVSAPVITKHGDRVFLSLLCVGRSLLFADEIQDTLERYAPIEATREAIITRFVDNAAQSFMDGRNHIEIIRGEDKLWRAFRPIITIDQVLDNAGC